ncbi:MAG: segregation/condensation protein A [Selenomonadaceae bacterium]|nr:segregation/condensation protein A [Selenomonadaceae bacterium]
MEQYSIRLECFEGPMELLMHLIEKNKIDIYDIPIASLTEQYIEYLDKFRSFDIEIASEFIIMAATLLQIKSRMLLPKPPKEKEADPRQELIERILEYRRFKEVSSVMGQLQRSQERFLAREPMDLPVRHLPPKNLSLNELLEAFANVLAMRRELKIPQVLVAPEEFSVQDKMEELVSLLHRRNGRLRFADAFQGSSRAELITTFLAMLELIKLRSITVQQQGQFGEIYLAVRLSGEAGGAGNGDADGNGNVHGNGNGQ